MLIRKRISRFLVLIILFCSFQFAYLCHSTGIDFSFKSMFHAYFNPLHIKVETTTGGLSTRHIGAGTVWFLYAYLGFLPILPMLRPIVVSITRNVYMYMAGLNMLLLAIIPTLYYLALRTYPDLYINQYVPVVSGSYIKGCAYSVFFFLWGYFVEEHSDI